MPLGFDTDFDTLRYSIQTTTQPVGGPNGYIH